MLRTHDNWERLVAATLKREEIRELCHAPSISTVSSRSSDFNSIELVTVNDVESTRPESIFVNGKPLDGRELIIVYVNDKALSFDELVTLQNCPNPPKKLKPTGRYWYDKVSGFWGKEGEKPLQIITADLPVGYPIRKNASNGNTNVVVNNREITKPELLMLQAAGVYCKGYPHFWVSSDGSYQLEGMSYVMGKLWKERRVRLICRALSLPFHLDSGSPGEKSKNSWDWGIYVHEYNWSMMLHISL